MKGAGKSPLLLSALVLLVLVVLPLAVLAPVSIYCSAPLEHSAERWWHPFLCDLKITDFLLATFTYWLALLTGGLIYTAIRQEGVLHRSVAAATKAAEAARDSADADVRSVMPVLFPYVTNMAQLHPLRRTETPITHDANVLIAFDNYGKTPATIRQVRAQLFLTDRDELPDVDIETLPLHSYPVMVPGQTSGKDITTGALDLKQSITFSPTELSELLSEAKNRFRRFALIGKVVYDDFFGNRHTSRFCVKMRMWKPDPLFGVHFFQIAQGGSNYNKVTTEKIPNPDSLENT